MIKKLFKKIKKQQRLINLGRGTYVQTALHTHTIHSLAVQNPSKHKRWATYKRYKTT